MAGATINNVEVMDVMILRVCLMFQMLTKILPEVLCLPCTP